MRHRCGFDERVKRRDDGRPLSWTSHRNIYLQSKPYNLNVGDEFGQSHEIWQHLEPGDYLAVFGIASTSEWECQGRKAFLLFDTVFDPSDGL